MNLILVAVIAVFVGSLVLLAMVRYDLAPIGGLARGRQWLLATALGTGILAFAERQGRLKAEAVSPR
ncbi:MAG: hypothetical protein ABW095_11920 [Candidatus Thiodiazotropha sp.]